VTKPALGLALKVWRLRPTVGGTAGGQDLCVAIDTETRGMHVQQAGAQGGYIVIVGATGDAAVRGMRRGDILTGVHHIPLPEQTTLQHVQQLMESLPRPLSLNLFRSSPYEPPVPVAGGGASGGASPAESHPLPKPADPLPRGPTDDYAAFHLSVVRSHKGYLLTELHHKEDPEATRLEVLLV
jgi:hypothetical protein